MSIVVISPPLAEAVARLRQLALFREVPEDALESIAHELTWLHLHGGELLFQQGDPGDGLYVLVSGRLEVLIREGTKERILRVLGRGEVLGELELWGDGVRTASIRAARDSVLVRASQAAFFRDLVPATGALLALTRTLVERLRSGPQPARTRGALLIGLVALQPSALLVEFARRLASSLAAHGRILHLDSRRVDQALGANTAQAPQGAPTSDSLATWLSEHEEHHDLVILEADPTPTAWTQRCVRQADTLLVVADATAAPDGAVLALLQQQPQRATSRRELVLIHPRADRSLRGTMDWLRAVNVDAHHHVALAQREHFARLARILTGNAIMLVLGAGGARGFAHVGVYRALCEAGIPIDLVGGTSMGALIGAQIALGWDPAAIQARSREIFLDSGNIFDVTLPMQSLIAGEQLSRNVERVVGRASLIEDLWRRFFCVSSSLLSAKQLVHERGPLWRCVTASGSIPGIAPPVAWDDDLLVDGGVLNATPTDVAARIYKGLIIAVKVPCAVTDTTYSAPSKPHHPLELLWRRLNARATDPRLPMLFDVLLRSAYLRTMNDTEQVRQTADLLLEPPVAQFAQLDPGPMDSIIEIGYRSSIEQAVAWRDQLDARARSSEAERR